MINRTISLALVTKQNQSTLHYFNYIRTPRITVAVNSTVAKTTKTKSIRFAIKFEILPANPPNNYDYQPPRTDVKVHATDVLKQLTITCRAVRLVQVVKIGNKLNRNEYKRAFTANSEWPDKEEFLDVIYWARQVIGIILGIVWGIVPLKGFLGLALFAIINAGVIYFYFSNFQNVDEEEYDGAWELTKEGFMTSFAGFLVTWIIIYSGLYYNVDVSS
ncbi:hypothetical protein GWI33_002981 [Rhynchophorus ferrugineus]|uniref:Uncharacterized protein n=1 Tax=Rhynchophorus ferrugineus TaxID=354439 RepID=A0A834IJZ9_RHYFE|nr:hypothetical protein GWI33_002981 [Rhynchophorus ferrugineus]